MKKTILTYGLYSGAISALLMFATAMYYRSHPGEFENGEWIGYAGMLLSMAIVFFGVRKYRELSGDAPFTFGKAFRAGFFMILISGLCYTIAWMIVSRTLMPDFMDQFMAFQLDKMRAAGASVEAIAKKTAEMQHFKAMYANPFVAAGITFLEPFPAGLFVALVSAAVLRKR